MDAWFQEEENGIRYSYKITDVLYRKQSPFQLVEVVETEAYGRTLLIDGLVMVTDVDEFVYHELIAHIPALLHKNPKNAVVIGGGDGGTVRELLKHPSIEKITLCEIDEVVVNASKEFFPKIAGELGNKRVDVNIGDGLKYMAEHEPNSLDIVIVDSTDPVSCGEPLFSKAFYQSVARALKDDGIMVCQSESPWYKKEMLLKIHNNIRGGFDHLKPYIASIPTYPRGLWSFTLASKQPVSLDSFDIARFNEFKDSLNYLEEGVLKAVFQIPKFFRNKLEM